MFDERFPRINAIYDEVDQASKDLGSVDYQIQEIDDFLKNVNNKEIRDLREERSGKRDWLKTLDDENVILRHEIESLTALNARLNAQLDREISKNQKNG